MFELNLSPAWADAVFKRSSVRRFLEAPQKSELEVLGQLCKKLSWQGISVRLFKGPGLKSVIKGTDVYAVIVAKNNTVPELEGYMGEALVLEAVSLGLDTCWLGAGFHADIVNKNVNLQTDEHVNCVIAIGKANRPEFNPKRRSFEQLCGLDEKKLKELGPWQYAAVSSARVAPSAINMQPWNIEVTETTLSVLNKRVLIGKYAGVDRGICMLHAAVGAASLGRNPTWKKGEDGCQMRV